VSIDFKKYYEGKEKKRERTGEGKAAEGRKRGWRKERDTDENAAINS
jgi:hypothetical protein